MLNFYTQNRFNYVYLNDNLKFKNISFSKNFQKGINVIILDNYDEIEDSLKSDLTKTINLYFENIHINYTNSLIYCETHKNIISNYPNIIDISNNLSFRRLFNSLIPTHQKFLNDKYNGFLNLKKFRLFPSSDLNFICFLYSLSIMEDKNEIIVPLISEDFFQMFDNLTLTSVCKLMDEIFKNNKYQFFTFSYSDSDFINIYSKFYQFNYINIIR